MFYTIAYDIEVKTLYLSKENSKMVHIIGDKKEKREQLASILKNDLDPKKLKKLKTSN
jgi:CRISPR/Cas system-associated endoribonuclease Cas2